MGIFGTCHGYFFLQSLILPTHKLGEVKNFKSKIVQSHRACIIQMNIVLCEHVFLGGCLFNNAPSVPYSKSQRLHIIKKYYEVFLQHE